MRSATLLAVVTKLMVVGVAGSLVFLWTYVAARIGAAPFEIVEQIYYAGLLGALTAAGMESLRIFRRLYRSWLAPYIDLLIIATPIIGAALIFLFFGQLTLEELIDLIFKYKAPLLASGLISGFCFYRAIHMGIEKVAVRMSGYRLEPHIFPMYFRTASQGYVLMVDYPRTGVGGSSIPFDIRLVGPDGNPVAHATVIAFISGQVAAEAHTDDLGRAAFTVALPEEGGVVLGEVLAMDRHGVELARASVRIEVVRI